MNLEELRSKYESIKINVETMKELYPNISFINLKNLISIFSGSFENDETLQDRIKKDKLKLSLLSSNNKKNEDEYNEIKEDLLKIFDYISTLITSERSESPKIFKKRKREVTKIKKEEEKEETEEDRELGNFNLRYYYQNQYGTIDADKKREQYLSEKENIITFLKQNILYNEEKNIFHGIRINDLLRYLKQIRKLELSGYVNVIDKKIIFFIEPNNIKYNIENNRPYSDINY
jgi:hypothetical protein